MGPQWICCQIGAREHYAVPRALHQGGRLAGLYTDFWAGAVVRKLGKQKGESGKQKAESRNPGPTSRAVRSLAGRFHPELSGARVESWNWRALFWEARLRKWKVESGKQKSDGGQYAGFID